MPFAAGAAIPAPILRTQDLTVRFGGLTALNQVSFEVRRDEIRALRRGDTSIMPEGLDRALTPEQFRDLLAFLQSLK